MKKYIWLGIRESEILYTDFIDKSITIFGKNNKNLQNELKKTINHNAIKNNNIINKFYQMNINKCLELNNNVKFMCYSQIYNYYLIKKSGLLDSVICLNNQKLVKFVHDKFKVKAFLKEDIPILKYTIIKGEEFEYKKLAKQFNTNELVAQTRNCSGGFGTFIIDKNTDIKLNKKENYMITKYCTNNLSINISVLISNGDICVLPGSMQIIERINNRLMYKGSDFIAYRELISKQIDIKAKQYAYIISEILQKKGYRGLLGIDMIVFEDDVYLSEINPRFQNSSSIINKSLKDNNLLSLQQLQYNCFFEKEIKLNKFDINYCTYINEYGQINKTFNINKIESWDLNNKISKYEDMSYISTDVYDKSILLYNGYKIGNK